MTSNQVVPDVYRRRKTMEERFWSKVDKSGECWVWTSCRSKAGYGVTEMGGFRLVHRLSYALAYGGVPDGMHVCHRCDNPPCVRPDHLFVGTDADNQADKVAKGRQLRGERNGPAKLKQFQVDAMRRDWDKTPDGRRTLAREYSVSESTVEKILAWETWR